MIESAAGKKRDGENGTAHALLGHDLRAALAEVRAGLALIQTLDVSSNLSEPIARCRAAGDALSRLIDQSILVCLGQAEPGRVKAQDFDTQEFFDGLRVQWSGRVAETGHRFDLRTSGDIPSTLSMDRTALERVLSNLIGNALLHTTPCQITTTIKNSGNDLLLISVQDEGVGFPGSHLSGLQHDFTIPPPLRRSGGGLGLQSVKQLVEAMGGRASARNLSMGGAEVSIFLPLPKPTQLPPENLAPQPDLTGLRLLMADDSATNRELVGTLARQIGAAITTVSDGDQAIAEVKASLPDLLILDDEMPGTSGLAVLDWLRSQTPPHSNLPVIILTSHIGAQELQAYRDAGANLVLSKPVLCPLELGQAVLDAMGATATLPPIDPAPLRRLRAIAGHDAAIELFARLEEDLTCAQAGLKQAAMDGNLAGVRAHSHVIIALAGTAGATRLHDEAVALNGLAHNSASSEYLTALALALDLGLAQLVATVRQEALFV